MNGAELKCNRCGADLPANAPEGLCPRCVAFSFSTDTEIRTGDLGPGGTVVTKPPPPAPLQPAEVGKLFPQLEIIGYLGRGGMGAVYKARQPRLDRIVALKILSPEKAGDTQFGERFQREARTLARLNHPNIVTVHDFGEAEGRFFLLMEFVDGLTLRQLLQSRKISPEEALAIVPKICEALQYAHERGIVHRDIKPENILLDKEGQVKIADFGIARILGQESTARLTEEKQVVGTPHYMAPEQIEKPQTVDHRADIFSLGVVFYEMLTGELPLGRFAAPSSRAHGLQIDVRLDEVVLRALEKEPDLRYQHASQVKQEVETIATSAKAQSTPEAVPRKPGRGLPKVAVAAVLVLLAVAALLLLPNIVPGSVDLRTLPADSAEIGQHRHVTKVNDRNTRPVPRPAALIPTIDIEGFLAEVPPNFRPVPQIMDHNTLRRQPGVRVLNAPSLRTLSGTAAELTIADIAVEKPARSFTLRALPALSQGKIVYQLDVTDNLRRLRPEAGVTNSSETARTFRSAGIVEPGAPLPFELGTLDNSRRLIGVVVFRLAQPGDSPANDSPTAFVSNPEFQHVINLEDTDRIGVVFFDFETGRLLKPPMRLAFDPNQPAQLSFSSELREWIAKEDVDVMFVLQGHHWHAISLDMEEQFLRNPANPDSFTPHEMEALVSPLTQRPIKTGDAGEITASSYFLTYTDKTRTPAAVFKTRKGNCGIYKWTSVADPKPGVKIRYRFWQNHDSP